MRFDYAIPVRAIEPLADGTLALIGVTADIVQTPSVPAAVQVSLAIAVSGSHTECVPEIEHAIEGRILDVQLNQVGQLHAGFTMQPGPNSPPGWDLRLQMPIVLRFEAAEFGTYSVELSIDKSSVSIPILVQPVPQVPEAEGQ